VGIRRDVGLGVDTWFDDYLMRVVGQKRIFLSIIGKSPLRDRFIHLYDLFDNRLVSVVNMCYLRWGCWGKKTGRKWRRRILVWEDEQVGECYQLLYNIFFTRWRGRQIRLES